MRACVRARLWLWLSACQQRLPALEERQHVRGAPCSTSDPAVINQALRGDAGGGRKGERRRDGATEWEDRRGGTDCRGCFLGRGMGRDSGKDEGRDSNKCDWMRLY